MNPGIIERVAVARLRRFERIAAVAEQSGSPIWQRLARLSARNAMRDVLLAANVDRALLSDPTITGTAQAA